MAWSRRRRGDPYERYYDDPRQYRRGGGGGSCVRDACLLDTGCCIAESLDGSCLVLAMLTVVRLLRLGLAGDQATHGGWAAIIVDRIRLYQRDISTRRPGCCRFSPTCSEYGAQAVGRHGTARGLALLAGRLLRCRPGGGRGLDPVP